MWIRKETYERMMERLGDLERNQMYLVTDNAMRKANDDLRGEVSYLREQLRVLIDSLGLVHQRTPAKEAYVKKGGPERG